MGARTSSVSACCCRSSPCVPTMFARLHRAVRSHTGHARPHSQGHSRTYGTGQEARRPASSLLSLDTLYPFLLLSAITSLALNLSHSRSAFTNEADHLRAQLSVLESLLAPERTRRPLSADEQERIERQLELVGLGRGKGKAEQVVQGRFGQTAWGEVFFGKKGREWEEDKAADEAEWAKRAFRFPVLQAPQADTLHVFQCSRRRPRSTRPNQDHPLRTHRQQHRQQPPQSRPAPLEQHRMHRRAAASLIYISSQSGMRHTVLSLDTASRGGCGQRT